MDEKVYKNVSVVACPSISARWTDICNAHIDFSDVMLFMFSNTVTVQVTIKYTVRLNTLVTQFTPKFLN